MKKYIALLLLSTTLSACSYFHPYRPDIQQGNIINPQRISQLKLGMDVHQVSDIMGSPVLENSFNDNEVMYVYLMMPNRGATVYKRVNLYFQRGRLVKIDKVNAA